MLCGQGSERIRQKKDRDEFARRLAEAVAPYASVRGVPFVLCAGEEMQHHFRRHAHIPDLLDEGVYGNPESLSPDHIATAATRVLNSALAARVDAAAAEIADACRIGMGSMSLEEIGRAAISGRVCSLLVAADTTVTGRLDPGTGLIVAADSRYLLDELAVEVLTRRGRVHVVPASKLPLGGSAAASFRHASNLTTPV